MIINIALNHGRGGVSKDIPLKTVKVLRTHVYPLMLSSTVMLSYRSIKPPWCSLFIGVMPISGQGS